MASFISYIFIQIPQLGVLQVFLTFLGEFYSLFILVRQCLLILTVCVFVFFTARYNWTWFEAFSLTLRRYCRNALACLGPRYQNFCYLRISPDWSYIQKRNWLTLNLRWILSSECLEFLNHMVGTFKFLILPTDLVRFYLRHLIVREFRITF